MRRLQQKQGSIRCACLVSADQNSQLWKGTLQKTSQWAFEDESNLCAFVAVASVPLFAHFQKYLVAQWDLKATRLYTIPYASVHVCLYFY